MFRAFIMWLKDVGKWVKNQKFNDGDDIGIFCFLFLATGFIITSVIALAWFTNIGKIFVGVLLIMFFIFINCKYSD